MVSLTMPSVSFDAHSGSGANGITGQKSHVTPCFSCLCLMDKMMPLMMQSVLHDISACTNGIT